MVANIETPGEFSMQCIIQLRDIAFEACLSVRGILDLLAKRKECVLVGVVLERSTFGDEVEAVDVVGQAESAVCLGYM